MSGILVAKCVSIAVIFVGSLVCGLLPAFRVFASFPRFALSLLLSFGGGILIATSLVHILPEARELWPDIRFTPEMSLCVGIFLVYFVEEVAHFLVCHDIHSLSHGGGAGTGGDGHNHGVHVHHEEPPNRCDEPAAVYLFAKEGGSRSGSGEYGLSNNSHNHNHSHHHHHSSSVEMEQQVKLFPTSNSNNSASGVEDKGHGHSHLPPASAKDDKARIVATLRSLVGLVALSIHAGLEGLSIGLGRDAEEVWYLCLAISAHKLVIAFCLGMEVRNASSSPCTLVSTSSSSTFKFRYVLSFALMTPIGIAVGTIITEILSDPAASEQTENTLVAVLQTLAGGTLLYVAFFEVVLRERARFSGKGLLQLLFVVMGFTVMVLLEIYVGSHDHSGKAGHSHAHGMEDHDHHHHEANETFTTTPLPNLVAAALSQEQELTIT